MSKLNAPGARSTPKTKYKAPPVRHVPVEITKGYSGNGNLQWNKEPLQHLYELAVSTLLGKDTFYRSSDTLVKNMKTKLAEAVQIGALDFIGNVAIHARVQMNIRSFPIMLVVEFAKILADHRAPYTLEVNNLRAELKRARSVARKNELQLQIVTAQELADTFNYENMRRLICDVIQRADQITDLYAYALEVFGDKSKVPMAVKRGVADAFNKFNEYHFGKYNRSGVVKFRDVLRIVHPIGKDERQGALFEKIMKETLATPYTWETELSTNGQLPKEERKTDKQLWTELLESGAIGYMALRSNVRNIVEAGVDADVLKIHVANVLTDPKRVAESKQFPFSFIQARDAIAAVGGNAIVRNALDKALEISCVNIPVLGEKLVLIIDKSGSMTSGSSTMRGFTPFDQAVTLAAMVVKAHTDQQVAVIVFGSDAEVLSDLNPNDSVNTIADKIRASRASGGTNFASALNKMGMLNWHPDAVLVMTDGEINKLYGVKNSIPTKALKVAVNFQAADTTPFPIREGWYPIAGWSDKVFRWLPAIHQKVTVVDALCGPYVGAEVMKAALRGEPEEVE
jgi:hypothetical protein